MPKRKLLALAPAELETRVPAPLGAPRGRGQAPAKDWEVVAEMRIGC